MRFSIVRQADGIARDHFAVQRDLPRRTGADQAVLRAFVPQRKRAGFPIAQQRVNSHAIIAHFKPKKLKYRHLQPCRRAGIPCPSAAADVQIVEIHVRRQRVGLRFVDGRALR